LWCRQPHPWRGVHGLHHVVDPLDGLAVDVLDILRSHAERGLGKGKNATDGHAALIERGGERGVRASNIHNMLIGSTSMKLRTDRGVGERSGRADGEGWPAASRR